MARELDSVQAERAGRSHIAPIGLAKLTCYSNRTTKAVAKVFYFSTIPITYPQSGVDIHWLPAIVGGSRFFT